MLNTVVRQIAFYRFETLLHDERRSGELLRRADRRALDAGADREPRPGLRLHRRNTGVYWAYIPHFIHSPFYVYAYAFGDCLVNALYGVFQDGASGLRAEIPRHAAGRRHQAAQGAAGALRARCLRPGILAARAGRDRRASSTSWSAPHELSRNPRQHACSASCGGWHAPPARWAASPRAWPGERMFGMKTDKTAHAEDLKTILGGLKGPLMKVAQFLSTVPDALPEEYAAGTGAAAGQCPADGLALRAPPHGRRAGPGLGVEVRELRPRGGGRAPSSARCIAPPCRTAREVACKLQYPDMPSAVEADLRQLKLAMSVYHRMDSAIDNERDLPGDARPAARGARLPARGRAACGSTASCCATSRRCRVPEPIEGYCTRRLLTMTWLDGRPLIQRLDGGPAARGAQGLSPRRCSAPGTCRSTATA